MLQGLAAQVSVLAVLAVSGCAAVTEMRAEVSTFGDWPAGHVAGTYAFERLPSQQVAGQTQQVLEDAAAPALARAGLQPAPAGTEPDLLVQVGARLSRSDVGPWSDPFWWHGGFGLRRGGPWRGPIWGAGWRMEPPRYDREVAVLIRDRASNKPLYEARASSEALSNNLAVALAPLYRAALMDFPATGINPRQVTVPLSP
jgi:hypothetical protein